jgi:hypothetical protein
MRMRSGGSLWRGRANRHGCEHSEKDKSPSSEDSLRMEVQKTHGSEPQQPRLEFAEGSHLANVVGEVRDSLLGELLRFLGIPFG